MKHLRRYPVSEEDRSFQYPQPRVYAMKLVHQRLSWVPRCTFSTLNLGSTR